MRVQAQDGYRALTEKEKQTLRLIARGHDAKSSARDLGLSVHTINERLREARRKMAVSSSREAARRLLAAESPDGAPATPQFSADIDLGEHAGHDRLDEETALRGGVRRVRARRLIFSGVLLMLILGLSALLFATDVAAPPATTTPAALTASQTDAADSARRFLTLIDAGRWDDSYRLTTRSFRELNSAQVWADVSEKVRPPLGAALARELLSVENLPAPPDGYEVVRFRTRFANKPAAVETVSLRREAGGWRVAGVTID